VTGLPYAVTLATAIACAVVGGVFFAFSSFVMGALGRLPAPQGIAAMQSINVVVINPVFMTALFGTGLACLVLIVAALASPGTWPRAEVITGAALYFVGNVVVTMTGNVPLNNRLAASDPESAAGAEVWSEYLVRWTAWNHVRAATAIAAAVPLVLALDG
jgi:uncharacterized membrane protein